jgi:hypothetical protein
MAREVDKGVENGQPDARHIIAEKILGKKSSATPLGFYA